MKYIALLRGINVGGHRKILMSDLRSLMEKAGFRNVRTYIQSGNIIVETNDETTAQAIEHTMENTIAHSYPFAVTVFVRTLSELEELLLVNPFLEDKDVLPEQLYVAFLKDVPSAEKLAFLNALETNPDKFSLVGRNIFVCYATKYSNSKFTNPFIEKKLNMQATMRNWKTLRALLTLAQQE